MVKAGIRGGAIYQNGIVLLNVNNDEKISSITDLSKENRLQNIGVHRMKLDGFSYLKSVLLVYEGGVVFGQNSLAKQYLGQMANLQTENPIDFEFMKNCGVVYEYDDIIGPKIYNKSGSNLTVVKHLKNGLINSSNLNEPYANLINCL